MQNLNFLAEFSSPFSYFFICFSDFLIHFVGRSFQILDWICLLVCVLFDLLFDLLWDPFFSEAFVVRQGFTPHPKLNSWQPSFLNLPKAGIVGQNHHGQGLGNILLFGQHLTYSVFFIAATVLWNYSFEESFWLAYVFLRFCVEMYWYSSYFFWF